MTPHSCPDSHSAKRVRTSRLLRSAKSIGLASALVCGSGCNQQQEPAGPHERVVLITVDTLRYDAFAGEEGGSGNMPRLTELAEQGLVFDNHFSSSSNTQPTHASLLTGLHPWQHGVLRNGMLVHDDDAMLAEIFAAEGFWTGAVVSSFPVTALFGFDRGFDQFHEELGRAKRKGDDEQVHSVYGLADKVTKRALELINGAPRTNQFLWFHYFDPHAPYGDTGSSRPIRLPALKIRAALGPDAGPLPVAKMRKLYGEDVVYVDEHLSQVIDVLLADESFRTHVIVTADHGEHLGDGFRVGHGLDLADAEVHVPLVILSPSVKAGRRLDPCGSVDLFATALALVGLEAEADHGRSLLVEAPGNVPVLGMRRIYEADEVPTSEWRPSVTSLHFYLRDGQSTVRGNGEGVSVDGVALTPERRQGVQDLFRSFERAVESLDTDEVLGLEAQRALEALGYAR